MLRIFIIVFLLQEFQSCGNILNEYSLWSFQKCNSVCGKQTDLLQIRDYLGRMVRIVSLRDWDAICEDMNDRLLESDVMEEEVIWWKVLVSSELSRAME